MAALGLAPEPAPTQITNRDRHAEYVSLLALIGASIERLAIEIRHLARTEVREVEEPFEQGAQKGSSSMPHKRNPWRSERLSGSRGLLRGYAQAAARERADVARARHRAVVGRARRAASTRRCVCDFALAEITEIVDGLVVYPERMRANMELSHGLYFSQHVLLALIDAGMSRDDAYRIVQEAAMRSWDEDRPYIEVLKEDERVTDAVDARRDLRRATLPREHRRRLRPARSGRLLDGARPLTDATSTARSPTPRP